MIEFLLGTCCEITNYLQFKDREISEFRPHLLALVHKYGLAESSKLTIRERSDLRLLLTQLNTLIPSEPEWQSVCQKYFYI